MDYKNLEEMFESNNMIVFKLYSMNYVMKLQNEKIVAYAIEYPEKKNTYNSFKEAMNNFKVYNEPIIQQIKNIEIIKQ